MSSPEDVIPNPTPTPVGDDFWNGWGGFAFGNLAMIVVGLLSRLLPESSRLIPTSAIFALGFWIDLFSSFCHIMTLVTRCTTRACRLLA